MPHYLVIDDATGALVSQGTTVASPLRSGLVALPVDPAPDWAQQQWDPALRTLVPRPAPVRDWCSQAEFYDRLGPLHVLANRLRLDPTTPIEVRAELETMAQLLAGVRRVELQDARTRAGAASLAALGAQAGLLPNTPEAIAAEAARILAPFPL